MSNFFDIDFNKVFSLKTLWNFPCQNGRRFTCIYNTYMIYTYIYHLLHCQFKTSSRGMTGYKNHIAVPESNLCIRSFCGLQHMVQLPPSDLHSNSILYSLKISLSIFKNGEMLFWNFSYLCCQRQCYFRIPYLAYYHTF